MERPPSHPNLWYLLHLAAFLLALEGITQYWQDTRSQSLTRRLIILYCQYFHGLTHDPFIPRPPSDLHEWYYS